MGSVRRLSRDNCLIRFLQVYIPHIATVIHEQNTALSLGKGIAGAKHLNFEAMMVSNPMSVCTPSPLLLRSVTSFSPQDLLTHKRWALQQRCYYTDFYNASTCTAAFERLPFCLEAIQMSYMNDTVINRAGAMKACDGVYPDKVPGRSLENINVRVRPVLV